MCIIVLCRSVTEMSLYSIQTQFSGAFSHHTCFSCLWLHGCLPDKLSHHPVQTTKTVSKSREGDQCENSLLVSNSAVRLKRQREAACFSLWRNSKERHVRVLQQNECLKSFEVITVSVERYDLKAIVFFPSSR